MGQHKSNPNSVLKSQSAPTESPITFNFGHDGTRVAMVASKPFHELRFTEEECEKQIKMLQDSLQALRDHKAGKPLPDGMRIVDHSKPGHA